MNAKTQRLVAIRELINSREIVSQEELAVLLKSKGFEATQSTLSRDLKVLQVAKVPVSGGEYVYQLPQQLVPTTNSKSGNRKIEQEGINGILSVEVSNNIAVLKTWPAYAGGIAATIDAANFYEILGTIAGDDTVFMVMREGFNRADTIKIVQQIFATAAR